MAAYSGTGANTPFATQSTLRAPVDIYGASASSSMSPVCVRPVASRRRSLVLDFCESGMLTSSAPELSEGPAEPARDPSAYGLPQLPGGTSAASSSWCRTGSMSRAEPTSLFQRASYASSSSHNSVVPSLGSVPPAAVPPAASAPYRKAFVAASFGSDIGGHQSGGAVSAAPGSSTNGRKRLHQEGVADVEDKDSKHDSKQLCSISAFQHLSRPSEGNSAGGASAVSEEGLRKDAAVTAVAVGAAVPVAVATACMQQGGDGDEDCAGGGMPRLRRPSQQPSQRRLLKMVTTSLESSEFAHLNLAVQEADRHRAVAAADDAVAASKAETPAAAVTPGLIASRSSSHGVAFTATAALEDAPAKPGPVQAQIPAPFIRRPCTSQRHQDAGRLHGFLGRAAAGAHAADASVAAECRAAPWHVRCTHAQHGILVRGLFDVCSEEDVYGTGWETPPLDAGNSGVVLADHLDLALVSLGSAATHRGQNTAFGGDSSLGGGGSYMGTLTWLGD